MNTKQANRKNRSIILLILGVLTLSLSSLLPVGQAQIGGGGQTYTSVFDLDDCSFAATGTNPHFILLPGYQLVLEGEEDGEEIRTAITVLKDTERIEIEGFGTIKTRVVEEREWVDGELAEVSRNFFAVCCQTNAVYYFGEAVDIYEDGEVVSHDGAWRAGQDGALPGLMMPGAFLLGSRYYQEVAPEIALDRAEHVDMGLAIETVAGVFTDCVEVYETTALDPEEGGSKFYCPGVGLVVDEDLELVEYGFINLKHWPEG